MRRLTLVSLLALAAAQASAAPLTADQAVKIALQHNTQVIQSRASLLDARSRLWGAYSAVLPGVSASYSATNTWQRALPPDTGTVIDEFGVAHTYRSQVTRTETNNYVPSVSARWNLLDLASLNGAISARNGSRAARLTAQATRNNVALETRRRFYLVVQDVHLAEVSTGALKRARDDERRVRALFEVGSVSKSDLLKARVATSQSELDSLLADHAVITARLALSSWLGLAEERLGDLDTTLVLSSHVYTHDEVFAAARSSRPDLQAADASVHAAEFGYRAARWSRLPYVTASGGASWQPHGHRKVSATVLDVDGTPVNQSGSDVVATGSPVSFSTTVALNLNIFDGLAMDAANASAKAGLIRARETRDALLRDLENEVRQALLDYQEAVEREALGRRTLESAAENLNLVQQKYNVGSATILDLIDSQVQLQRAQSDVVSALAAIQVAEAQLDQVRGRPQ
jgi:outer membrane protein TolC